MKRHSELFAQEMQELLTTDDVNPLVAWEIVTETESTITKDLVLARAMSLAGFEVKALCYRNPDVTEEPEFPLEIGLYPIKNQFEEEVVNVQILSDGGIFLDRFYREAEIKNLHAFLGRLISAGVDVPVTDHSKVCEYCKSDLPTNGFCDCIPF